VKHETEPSIPVEAPVDSDQLDEQNRWYDGRHWHDTQCNGVSFALEECGDVIAYTCHCGSAFTGWSG